MDIQKRMIKYLFEFTFYFIHDLIKIFRFSFLLKCNNFSSETYDLIKIFRFTFLLKCNNFSSETELSQIKFVFSKKNIKAKQYCLSKH